MDSMGDVGRSFHLKFFFFPSLLYCVFSCVVAVFSTSRGSHLIHLQWRVLASGHFSAIDMGEFTSKDDDDL